MQDITTKEIRGLSLKTIAAILTCFIGLLVAGVIGYSNIMHSLEDNQKSSVVMQLQIDILKADLKALQLHQTDQDIRLTRIEEQIKDKIFMTNAPN